MSQITFDVEGRATEIRAQGVVEISPSVMNCNQENLLETANKLVDEMRPAPGLVWKVCGQYHHHH